MSLSSALHSAVTGLTAVARQAGAVSSNVANSTQENYGRREVELASRTVGRNVGGVRVVGEFRMVDAGLLADRRTADAQLGQAAVTAKALERIDGAIGLPGEAGALATYIADFEAALTEAASRPDARIRLDAVVRSAGDLADGIGRIGSEVQGLRAEADRQIGLGVDRLNDTLARIEQVNRAILREVTSGRQPNGLFDERQRLVDDIAEVVPLRQMERANGQIALYTDTGAILLDGSAAQIGFAAFGGPIGPGTTMAGGILSGLTLNGIPISTGHGGPLGGGALSAQFELRDRALPETQAGLDALARDLIARFETAADMLPPAERPDLAIFVDGAPPVPADDLGLAQRLTLAPALLAGGSWQLRDGLDAVVQGPPGDARNLALLAGALAARTTPATGGFSGTPRDVSGLAAELHGRVGGDRIAAEGRLSFAQGQNTALRDAQARDGVNTDDEMQKLLLIERAYAANARVIQAVDEMLRELTRI